MLRSPPYGCHDPMVQTIQGQKEGVDLIPRIPHLFLRNEMLSDSPWTFHYKSIP